MAPGHAGGTFYAEVRVVGRYEPVFATFETDERSNRARAARPSSRTPRVARSRAPLRRRCQQLTHRRRFDGAPRGTATTSPGRSTTSPVTPSTTASRTPPARPATCGTPLAAASRKTMPKPSCSNPSHRVRRTSRHVRAIPAAWQVLLAHPAEEANRSPEPGRPTLKPRPVRAPYPPIAHLSLVLPRPRQRPHSASMSTSNPFRGTSRLTPTDDIARCRSPKCSRLRPLIRGIERAKPVGSTPGGMRIRGGSDPPSRLRASWSGDVPAAMTNRGPGEHFRRTADGEPGRPSGNGHFRAVNHDTYGTQRSADATERKRRDRAGRSMRPISRGEPVDAPTRSKPAEGASSRDRSIRERPGPGRRPRAPGCAEDNDREPSGGSRRQSS